MTTLQTVHSLLQRAADEDPVLRDTLILMCQEIDRLAVIVDPPPVVAKKFSPLIQRGAPKDILDFDYEFKPTNLVLFWVAPQTGFLQYEIRKGSSWQNSTLELITTDLRAILDPIPESATYHLKSINPDGIYSAESASVFVDLPDIQGVTITSSTIDSNVLLYWTPALGPFQFHHYRITRDGELIIRLLATFVHIKELAGGIFTYGVQPVDIANRYGPIVSVQIEVHDPPDFVLRDTFISDFLLGIHDNTKRQLNGRLLVLVNTTETWEGHFISRSWLTPQNQIDAGYPIYIQPVPTTGSYTEVFDIGIILPGLLITISWSYFVISGTFNIGARTRVSDDGIVWSEPQDGQNVYFPSGRYIEVKMMFTGLDDTSLMDFYNFEIAVSTKEELDSGEVQAIASDVNGTFVTFNKSFKDVNSITESVESTTEQFIVIHRFNDIPNPIGFAVFVYDTSGIRVSKTVLWKARGTV